MVMVPIRMDREFTELGNHSRPTIIIILLQMVHHLRHKLDFCIMEGKLEIGNKLAMILMMMVMRMTAGKNSVRGSPQEGMVKAVSMIKERGPCYVKFPC